MKVVFLQGIKTVLRPLEKSDVPLITKWINDPEVSQYIAAYLPATEGEEEAWIENLAKKKDQGLVLAIEVNGKHIGNMGVHDINWRNRTATTGALIGEKEYWGKGFGKDAKMIFLDYLFNTLNLRKISSSVIAFNKRSLNYSLACGYVLEGRKRRQMFRKGRYYDEIILGLFKNEWLPYWREYKARLDARKALALSESGKK